MPGAPHRLTGAVVATLRATAFRSPAPAPAANARSRPALRAAPAGRARKPNTKPPIRHRRKPDLQAENPHLGCRKIADLFNRLYFPGTGVSVGKTYTNSILREHKYAILTRHRALKNRIPFDPPRNKTWGLDLTGKTDDAGNTHAVLGIVEHRSRRLLTLEGLNTRTATTLIRRLCDVVDAVGTPTNIRTDNEPLFHARLWQIALRL